MGAKLIYASAHICSFNDVMKKNHYEKVEFICSTFSSSHQLLDEFYLI
jgi:hypothetical protein